MQIETLPVISRLTACLAALVLAALPMVAFATASTSGPGAQARPSQTAQSSKSTAKAAAKKAASRKVAERADPGQPSFGQVAGLHGTGDDLALKSSVALVIDQDTDEVLFSKNSLAVLPIASITKLMTALVVTEAQLPLDEVLTVTQEDVVATSGSTSRLTKGTQLTRREMLHLALMSSENRAAHVLGRT